MSAAGGPGGGFVRADALGHVPDPWGNAGDPNTLVIAEGHYDHGDYWHHHHRRHHHLFHDHHYVQGASESLNLTPAQHISTHIIPNPNPPEQSLTLAPGMLGKWAFENGAAEYGFAVGAVGGGYTPMNPGPVGGPGAPQLMGMPHAGGSYSGAPARRPSSSPTMQHPGYSPHPSAYPSAGSAFGAAQSRPQPQGPQTQALTMHPFDYEPRSITFPHMGTPAPTGGFAPIGGASGYMGGSRTPMPFGQSPMGNTQSPWGRSMTGGSGRPTSPFGNSFNSLFSGQGTVPSPTHDIRDMGVDETVGSPEGPGGPCGPRGQAIVNVDNHRRPRKPQMASAEVRVV